MSCLSKFILWGDLAINLFIKNVSLKQIGKNYSLKAKKVPSIISCT